MAGTEVDGTTEGAEVDVEVKTAAAAAAASLAATEAAAAASDIIDIVEFLACE